MKLDAAIKRGYIDETGVTANAGDTYTCGECYTLAWELHTQSGLPLAVVRTLSWWDHVMVQDGDSYIDVWGAQSLEEVIKSWWSGGNTTVELLPAMDFAGYLEHLKVTDWHYRYYPNEDMEQATKEVAAYVLREYESEKVQV